MTRTILKLLLLSVLVSNCNNFTTTKIQESQNKTMIKNQISTFLTFQDNNAEKAMNFYVALFDNSKIIKVDRWGKGGPVEEGKIMHATFELNGSLFMCSDSPPVHEWNFSPAVSNFINCESEEVQEKLFTKLSENGTVTMPLYDWYS